MVAQTLDILMAFGGNRSHGHQHRPQTQTWALAVAQDQMPLWPLVASRSPKVHFSWPSPLYIHLSLQDVNVSASFSQPYLSICLLTVCPWLLPLPRTNCPGGHFCVHLHRLGPLCLHPNWNRIFFSHEMMWMEPPRIKPLSDCGSNMPSLRSTFDLLYLVCL